MAEAKRLTSKLVKIADLQDEPIPGLPLLELAGDQRVLIENHNGVVEYGAEAICIRVKFGLIEISGSHLELSFMTRGQLIITGCIECIQLSRRM